MKISMWLYMWPGALCAISTSIAAEYHGFIATAVFSGIVTIRYAIQYAIQEAIEASK